MIKTIAFVFAASVPSDGNLETDPNVICPSLGRAAYAVMDARQAGVPVSKAMELAGDNDFWKAVVLQAYAVPRFSVDENKKQASDDFRNAIELGCYQAFQSDE